MENKCQLIKKSNPCNCKQFVRFGLSQGWISKETLVTPRPLVAVQARDDIRKMKTVRDIYQDLYQDKDEGSLAQRIREGIKNKEWSIFS
jgi:RNA polymerase sigma-70 factor, ECF subfamily